jgi:two-component system chemotaxis response regulator CheB
LDPKKRIRVLLVDDSAAFRAALAAALGTDPEIVVVGQAADGEEAIARVEELAPDVVTMDVVMPKLDGLEAAKRLLAAERPVPILLLTTLARSDEQRLALNALRLGVVDVTNKPVLAGPNSAAGISAIRRLIRAAASVHVTRRLRSRVMSAPTPEMLRQVALVAIAASTGGPPAVEVVARALPAEFPPVVVAQHLAPSFARGFADWLSAAVRRRVVTVGFAEPLQASTIYVAGESSHVRVRDGMVEPVACGRTELAPNGDVLFSSVAQGYGARSLGIVLTGMGNDGAAGLKQMRQAGAWTVAQDAASSLVYGMPRVAWEAGACCEQLTLEAIAARVQTLLAGWRLGGVA